MPNFTQDQDFMQASRSDQIAYLKSVDKDFAAASSADQSAYLASITGRPDYSLNPPPMPKPPNAIQQEIDTRATNPMAGFPGGITGAPHVATDKELAAAGGFIGAAAGTVAAPAIAEGGTALGKWMVANPGKTAMAVHIARKLRVPIPKVLDIVSEFTGEE